MITELIGGLILALITFVLSIIPVLSNIALPDGFITWFTDVVSMTAYFLPIADMLTMFGLWLLIVNFEIVWKTVQRVWDALPFT